MDTLLTIVLVAATVTTGLMAGLFFTYTNNVMPALARSNDRSYVEVMQHINVVIVNGRFLLNFVGSLLLTGAAVALSIPADTRAVLPWTIAAFVFYAGTLIITGRFNIPLNNDLDNAGEPATLADAALVRKRFEDAWVRWNRARTATSIAAFVSLAIALIRAGNVTG
jgi:uncharacterized membrane protein